MPELAAPPHFPRTKSSLLLNSWLRLAGCKMIFYTSSFTGEGIADIISYLKEEHETLPWETVKAQYDKLEYGSNASDEDMNINGVVV